MGIIDPCSARVLTLDNEALQSFWERELGLFNLPEPVPEQIANKLAHFIENDTRFKPHTILPLVERIMSLEEQRQRFDPLSDTAQSIATSIERQATHAGFYWLAATGVFPGQIGANDGLGTWLFKEAALCTTPSNRIGYRSLARKFADVRSFIEYACYHSDHRAQYIKGPRT